MKYFAATTAALLALAASAVGQSAPTIQTPAAIVQCQPVAITFGEGTAPYYISILPGGDISAVALESLPTQSSAGSYTWTADIAAGTAITFQIRDSTGQLNYAQAVTIQSGSDSSCLGQNTASTSGSSSAAASSASASASSSSSSSPSASASASTARVASSVSSALSSASSVASSRVSSISSALSSSVSAATAQSGANASSSAASSTASLATSTTTSSETSSSTAAPTTSSTQGTGGAGRVSAGAGKAGVCALVLGAVGLLGF